MKVSERIIKSSKNGMGQGLPGSHSHAKFYRFGLVYVGLRSKNRENANLWYTFAPEGHIHLGDFYKIFPGRGSPRTALSCEISTL